MQEQTGSIALVSQAGPWRQAVKTVVIQPYDRQVRFAVELLTDQKTFERPSLNISSTRPACAWPVVFAQLQFTLSAILLSHHHALGASEAADLAGYEANHLTRIEGSCWNLGVSFRGCYIMVRSTQIARLDGALPPIAIDDLHSDNCRSDARRLYR